MKPLPTHTIETVASGSLLLRDHGGEPCGMYSGPSAMQQGAFWADTRRGWTLEMVDEAVKWHKAIVAGKKVAAFKEEVAERMKKEGGQ